MGMTTETTMDREKDGPIRKFYLIKQYGALLRHRGLDPREMSCREIETELLKIHGVRVLP
jgi:hypothetical protein